MRASESSQAENCFSFVGEEEEVDDRDADADICRTTEWSRELALDMNVCKDAVGRTLLIIP